MSTIEHYNNGRGDRFVIGGTVLTLGQTKDLHKDIGDALHEVIECPTTPTDTERLDYHERSFNSDDLHSVEYIAGRWCIWNPKVDDYEEVNYDTFRAAIDAAMKETK